MERKPTTIGLTIQKYFPHTKLHHLAREKAEENHPNPSDNTKKSQTQLSLIPYTSTRNIKIKP